MSRGRWTATASAPVGIDWMPNIFEKNVGVSAWSVTRIADHDCVALGFPESLRRSVPRPPWHRIGKRPRSRSRHSLARKGDSTNCFLVTNLKINSSLPGNNSLNRPFGPANVVSVNAGVYQYDATVGVERFVASFPGSLVQPVISQCVSHSKPILPRSSRRYSASNQYRGVQKLWL